MRRLDLILCLVLVALFAIEQPSRADDWPQWLGPHRDAIWRESGILDQFPKDGPPVRWRTPIGGGYAGPAVVGGRVYVTDRILARDARNPGSGFEGNARIQGKERVLCLHEATGKELWKVEYNRTYQVQYPAGPRTTPIVHGGKVYTLGTMGDLLCLDAATGKQIWAKNFPRDYKAHVPVWGFSANPLLDDQGEHPKLICLVGGEDHVVVAFDKDTGKELWHALSADEPGYSPPMIYQFGGKRQLIIWHPEAVNGLNPDTGEVYWSEPFTAKAGLTAPTARQAGNLLFVTAFYDGPLMLQFAAANPRPTVLWRGKSHSETPKLTDGLHSIIATPFLKDGYIYGVCSYGELRCLKADTGKRIWQTHAATGGKSERWANAFLVEQGERFFLFNEKGDLIIARLTPDGYKEISRAHILDPTNSLPGRPVVWSHPAFANKSMYVRNDEEIVCVSLAAPGGQ
jgi:outer membrane protein assembly factor BamB